MGWKGHSVQSDYGETSLLYRDVSYVHRPADRFCRKLSLHVVPGWQVFYFSVIVNKCSWCFSNTKRSTEEPKPVETTERQKVEFPYEVLRILVSYFFI